MSTTIRKDHEDLSTRVDDLSAQLWNIYATTQNQKNFEDQMQFQKDAQRDQMLYQNYQTSRAEQANSLSSLLEQAKNNGLSLQDALGLGRGNQTPMSAPSGQSAPRAVAYDTSMLAQMFQRRHEARMDDLQRALGASKMLTDDALRERYQKDIMKMMHDMLMDKENVRIQDFNAQMKARQIAYDYQQHVEQLADRHAEWVDAHSEQKRHNKAVEQDDPWSHTLGNIIETYDFLKSTFNLDLPSPAEAIERAKDQWTKNLDNVKSKYRSFKEYWHAFWNSGIRRHPQESGTSTYR